MNENSQAILLLTVRFGASKPNEVAPLGPAEYGRLAAWLKENDHKPHNLLRDLDDVLAPWTDPRGKITKERIQALLNRGMAMGVALEKWQGAGLWILTRADSDYPKRLKQHLKFNAPAVLFGAGNKRLLDLDVGVLAIIGSRDINEADEAFAKNIAIQAAQEGMNVVSGGARGVDKTAMQSALEADGTAVGVLANGLLKTALSSTWRTYIKRKQLCLITSYSPEAGFNRGNAMGRNKYIYCLSDFALVVQSAKGSGGTWAGATENLKKQWATLFVQGDTSSPGLEDLAKRGASRLTVPRDVSPNEEWLRQALQPTEISPPDPEPAASIDSFYALFLNKVKEVLAGREQVSLSDLKTQFPDLCERQIKDWLDLPVSDNHLKRHGKAQVYSLREQASKQPELDLKSKKSE